MKILYKFASRSRPQKFFETLENIRNMAHHDDYTILCSLDVDDPAMKTQEVLEILKFQRRIRVIWGHSKNKVDAINRNMDTAKDFDILINMSDDMRFIQPGFDLKIIEHFEKYFLDLDGVIHYPDGNVNQLLMTMSIMGKTYFDRFGYIYHPSYTSLFCDNEATDVAKILGKYKFINEQLFEHLHPAFRKSEMDEQYKHTESFYAIDGAIYKQRQSRNFDLN
jgi:hypothetical protein